MNVRTVQADPEHGAPRENVRQLEAAAERARAADVDLLVFPELFLTGYYLDTDDAASTVAAAENVLPRVADASIGLVLVVGTAFEGDDGFENTAILYDDGERVGTYQKTHLYDEEAAIFETGDTYPTFDTSVGTLGVEICYDLEFPEVARQLTLNSADVIVTISANMQPFETYHRTYHRSRAMENGRPHVLCNRVGSERDLDFLGNSRISDARGNLLASTETDAEVELTADIPLDQSTHKTLTYLDDRRLPLATED
ncbi:carbon-nitrogen hydrolase family protein [Halobacterium noricense]|uniref:carbon-nitrogen hydrolase family protein n=1 Tax=Halobacterium noricense TaxID=223182 RepID=UPI001E321F70|nr:carbon-nitrogen hydrolase family protein [Halobacterium noricense]UHH26805.1 carbon-nitrogen hydrolase family protein [Halobacterium noricense]